MPTLQQRVTTLAQAIGADIAPLTNRLIVQASATAKAWVIRRFSSGATGNLLEFQDENGNVLGYFAPNGSFFISPAGSTFSNPKKFGFSPNFLSGEAARQYFGDEGAGGFQIGFDARMQIYSFNGMTFQNGRDTGAPALIPFVAGSTGNDFLGTNPARRIIDVTAPSGQSVDLQRWTRSGVTGTMGVDKDVNLRFRDDTVQKTAMQTVWLAADVVNQDATANTLYDITGLAIPVKSGVPTYFKFYLAYASAATTTGSRWTISGPAKSLLVYSVENSLTTSSRSVNYALTSYGLPSGANASSADTTGNSAVIEGVVIPTADGTLTPRFASEIASSAITAKVGSHVLYYRSA